MKLKQHLSPIQFILSQVIILAAGLIFLGTLHYLLNIQYQQPRNPFLVGPVTAPPQTFRLEVDQPEDNSLVFQPSITISGQTAPSANVLIYTDNDNFVIESDADGSFSTKWTLDEGVNKLTITVFDPGGDSKSLERMVYYSKEKI